MAEGHAKLSLRHEVTVYDALAAIKLYEENMALHSGYSPILQYDAQLEASEVSQFYCQQCTYVNEWGTYYQCYACFVNECHIHEMKDFESNVSLGSSFQHYETILRLAWGLFFNILVMAQLFDVTVKM